MSELYHFEASLKRLLERIEKLDRDKEPLKKWYLHLKIDKSENLSTSRIVKLLGNANIYSDRLREKSGKRLIDATKEDIVGLIIEINDSNKAALTKRDYRIAIKKFLTFAGKGDIVEWIKTSVSAKENKRKLPEDMLTESEIEMLIAKPQNPRDKALISLLSDSGLRIGKALKLRIKDIYFDEYGAYLIIPEGKTGSRRVRLIASIHYLKNWLENHPDSDRDNWLFVTLDKHGDMLKYNAARKGLMEAVAAAGIKKRIHPHLFRHTAATRAAGFMTEQEMKAYFGWDASSEMAATYVHMNGEQVDNKILSHYGLKKIEDNGKDMLIKCPKCSKLNPKTAKFCGNCSCILDMKLMTQSDLIKFEDLQIQNMVQNHCLAKSISDAGWYQLMNLTDYKAAYAGKFVELVNPAGTSQTCICGFSVPKDLSVRVHRCPSCGLVMGRDRVSANVIEIRPSICTVGTTGIHDRQGLSIESRCSGTPKPF